LTSLQKATIKSIKELGPERPAVTFRVDSRIVEGLQREADINGVSLNILINQLLKRYYDWGKYESKLNMMSVPKVMLSSCMDISDA